MVYPLTFDDVHIDDLPGSYCIYFVALLPLSDFYSLSDKNCHQLLFVLDFPHPPPPQVFLFGYCDLLSFYYYNTNDA